MNKVDKQNLSYAYVEACDNGQVDPEAQNRSVFRGRSFRILSLSSELAGIVPELLGLSDFQLATVSQIKNPKKGAEKFQIVETIEPEAARFLLDQLQNQSFALLKKVLAIDLNPADAGQVVHAEGGYRYLTSRKIDPFKDGEINLRNGHVAARLKSFQPEIKVKEILLAAQWQELARKIREAIEAKMLELGHEKH